MELELRQYPEVRDLFSIVGQASVPGAVGALSGTNQAQMTALLVPRAQRQRSSAELAEDVRQRFEGHFPGAKVRVGMPNPFAFGGVSGAPIHVQVPRTAP